MARTSEHNKVDYLLKNIPGDLWDQFKIRCDTHTPKISMRWAIIQLVTRFVGAEPQPTPKPPDVRRKKKVVPLVEPIRSTPELAASQTAGTLPPDLGDIF